MLTTLTIGLVYSNVVTRYSIHTNTDNRNQAKGHSTMKLTDTRISLETEELEAIRDVLTNETAWDRDDTSEAGGVYIGTHTPGYNGVHDQTSWTHLDNALKKIKGELEFRVAQVEAHKQRNR